MKKDVGMQAWLKAIGQWLPGSTAGRPDNVKSASGPLVAIEHLGQPVWAPRDFSAFAREGMMQNPVVYRCVRVIAEAAASVPMRARGPDGNAIEAHGMLSLLKAPMPGCVGADLLESALGYLLVSGNLYIEAIAVGGEVKHLHVLRPDRVRVVPGSDGWPAAHEYSVGGARTTISGEAVDGVPRLLHMKLFHPLNDHYGLSPIEAAATAIDIHNAASRWNKALLDNAARPSGALVYTSGGQLTSEQFGRLKSELEDNFQGAKNAGRPLLLEGGLDWKAMSLTPRDMDFIDAKHAAAREIALSLGVPPMLLGIPGDNTYANMQEANRVFWRQTVIPLIQKTSAALSRWLAPAWPDQPVSLCPDLDQVEALRGEREALWKRLEAASFLTGDEKRAAVGYGPLVEDKRA
jgi:HK97 family phage portal protein